MCHDGCRVSDFLAPTTEPSVRPDCSRAGFVNPHDVVCQRGFASELLNPGRVLATVIKAVHHTLQSSFAQGGTESGGEPGHDELLVKAFERKLVEKCECVAVVLPRGRLQLR